jgi:uncharacterized membrane protein
MAKKASTQLIHIRMPKDLQRRIQREAAKHGQTTNAEILARLAQSFESGNPAAEEVAEIRALIARVHEKVAESRRETAEAQAELFRKVDEAMAQRRTASTQRAAEDFAYRPKRQVKKEETND